jgi:hypothetical protein
MTHIEAIDVHGKQLTSCVVTCSRVILRVISQMVLLLSLLVLILLFVAVEPKMYKSPADMSIWRSSKKFAIALAEFSKLGIKSGVYQGDMMFTKGDVKVETIRSRSST